MIDKKKYINLNSDDLENEFIESCFSGDLEVVKYLLTSSDLKKNVDIHIRNDCGFRYACLEGHLEIVKYLLTSSDLKEHVDIHVENNGGFTNACNNGKLNIVKYLLTSSELKEKADIHADNDYGFRSACFEEHTNIVKFLIFEMKIDKTKNIQEYLEKKQVTQVHIENMFKIRELNEQLNKEVSINKLKNKKIKL